MSTEILLFGTILLILAIDFSLNTFKKFKSRKGSSLIIKEYQKIKESSLKDYIINRKRNIMTFILLFFMLKPIIHFIIFPSTEDYYDYKNSIDNFSWDEYKNIEKKLSFFINYDSTENVMRVLGHSDPYRRVIGWDSERSISFKDKFKNTPPSIDEMIEKTGFYVKEGKIHDSSHNRYIKKIKIIEINRNTWIKYTISKVNFISNSKSLRFHLQNSLKEKVWIYLISFFSLGTVVFLFNDKLRAR